MKRFIKNNYIYLLTFGLSVLLILLALIMNKITPFGNNTLSNGDMYLQYESFLQELLSRLKSGSSLFYSLNNGLGYSFFGTIVSYLMSPTTIIYLLFNKFDIHKIFDIIIFIKPICAGLSMTYFLYKKFNSNKWYISILSLLYGFCSFFNAYAMYVNWMDAFVLLPLVILGLEDLVNDKKSTLYSAILFFIMITSYYQAFMVCIFVSIYFIMYAYYKDKISKERIILFVKSSLKSALLASFILVPIFFLLKGSGAALSGTVNEYPYNLVELLAALFTGSHVTRLSTVVRGIENLATNTPNIGVGLIPVLLFISYLFNKKISTKNKKVYIGLLLILLLFFMIPILDTFMHGLHAPNDMPFRYSYFFSFILIIISMYELEFIEHKEFKLPLIIISILVALLLLFRPINIDFIMIIVDIIIIGIYLGVYFLYRKNIRFKPLLITMVILLSFIECLLNVDINLYKQDINIRNDYSLINTNVEYIKLKDKNTFYRIGTYGDPNLGSRYNYRNFSFFNSINNKGVGNLMNKLGLDNYRVSYFSYKDATPVVNLMFNVKYNICMQNEYYDEVIKNIYSFRYNKGLMFEVSSDILSWDYSSDNPFINQNDLVNKISKIDDLFTSVNISKIEKLRKNEYIYEVNTDRDYIYLYLDNIKFLEHDGKIYYVDLYEGEDSGVLSIAKGLGVTYEKEEKTNGKRIVKLDVRNSKSLTIYFKNDDDNNVLIYEMNNEKFETFANTINNLVDLSKINDDSILGAIDVKEDNSIIFTSLEYNDGWQLYIDAERKDENIVKVADSLVGIKLDKGLHTIYLKYELPYYREGMIISLITIVMLSLYKIIDITPDKEENIDN